ncbi:Glycolipid 2-alpha-mannosyltransferase [Gracilaria domingensis]|nr:Glycolipid 2-alpha-mannosyltransferase [Gracilaria domingensis]
MTSNQRSSTPSPMSSASILLSSSEKSEIQSSSSLGRSTWRQRLSLCYTLPHLAAFLSILSLCVVISYRLRQESLRQQEAPHLAERCAFAYVAAINRTNLKHLGLSLKSFNRHFHPLPYKLLILHDGLPPVEQGKLQSLSEAPVLFRPLQQTLNRTTTHITLETDPNRTRFWSYLALRQNDYLSDIDFLIRLEPRATFASKIKFDFVRSFVANEMQYAYPSLEKECSPNVTKSLRELAASYVELNGIRPRNEQLWSTILKTESNPCMPVFSNHFEVINLRFFRTHSGVQDWIRVVEQHGGVFHNGWYDGLLRYVTVAIYAAPSKTIRYGPERVPFKPFM